MNVPSKKIIYLISEDWFFKSHFMDRAKAAKDAGFTVYILSNMENSNVFDNVEFNYINIKIRRSKANILCILSEIFRVFIWYVRIKPDIVHHIGLKLIIIGSFVSLLVRSATVVNAPVGMGFVFSSNSLKARLLRPLVWLALRFALAGRNKVTVVENADDQRALSRHGVVGSSQIELIEGAGIDLNKFPYVERQKTNIPIVMLASRMLNEKGVREFVSAAAYLQKSKLTARFVLVGAPDPQNLGTIKAQELNNWDRQGIIEWWGHSNHMYDSLCSADIFCLPSYREGLPKVLLEASASGCAIITTDVPGCREVVQHMRTGILVKPRDYISVAHAIEQLVDDYPLRISLAREARSRVEGKFSNEVIIKKTMKIYEQAVEGNRFRQT
ncbi:MULTISPECIES: glycosyltransferase family 4 protein [unclassified Brucella]|uniref:glycosyltransferase family 4 protein n=1 Tax=unclassified Brucella TaxID=2632610 RepID=UPI00097279EA|nr:MULTISPECIES: glycosyltransferase family 4 protein [unclassified Brucella]APX69375.1 hypothetical protein BKD03_08190 [Brucella sp. 09RB8471]MRN79855.1 glycosyltransferase [Brucella sp. 10RB9210]